VKADLYLQRWVERYNGEEGESFDEEQDCEVQNGPAILAVAIEELVWYDACLCTVCLVETKSNKSHESRDKRAKKLSAAPPIRGLKVKSSAE